ncbi:MAG: DUF481 domain-containing protein [Vicinamibacterales bacterium]
MPARVRSRERRYQAPARAVVIVTLLTAVIVSPATGDELRLSNGDRLTGSVTSLADGTLVFNTPHGELKIPWADVMALTVEEPLVVRTIEGQVSTFIGGRVDVATVEALSRPEPPVVWTGGANAGFLATGGNTDVSSLRLDGGLVARAGANRYTFDGIVNRAEDTGRRTASNWTVSGRYDRFVTDRFYLNGSAIFTEDAFRELDLRTALGVALGYQALDTPRARASVEGGVGWVTERFATVPDNRYSALRESATLDVFVAGERVVLFHRNDGYFGITGDDNLFVKMQNGVRLGLAAGFVTSAQLDLDYNRSPAPGRVRMDRSFALTFGYRLGGGP